MKIFLTLKHWQMFLITWGIPFLIMIVIEMVAFTTQNFKLIFMIFPVVLVLFIGGLMGWMWSLGVNLQAKLPQSVKMNVRRFKAFILIPIFYMLGLGLLFGGIFMNKEMRSIFPAAIALILPLHIFSMFCMFYDIYFVAKTLKAVQLQREVKFEDYAGEFFMMWFYIIGIWIIQPRVNKIFASENEMA